MLFFFHVLMAQIIQGNNFYSVQLFWLISFGWYVIHFRNCKLQIALAYGVFSNSEMEKKKSNKSYCFYYFFEKWFWFKLLYTSTKELRDCWWLQFAESDSQKFLIIQPSWVSKLNPRLSYWLRNLNNYKMHK